MRIKARTEKMLVFIGLIVAFVLIFLLGAWVFHQWREVRVTPEKATVLLQQVVDDTPAYHGTVSAVILGNEICSQATGGNNCRVDVDFKVGNRPASGWCTYGIGQGEPRCGITTVN
jgi:hypothetical protein